MDDDCRFKEYTGKSLNKDKRPSVSEEEVTSRQSLKSLAKHRELEKQRKARGASLWSRLQKLLGVGKGYLERLPPVDVHKLLLDCSDESSVYRDLLCGK